MYCVYIIRQPKLRWIQKESKNNHIEIEIDIDIELDMHIDIDINIYNIYLRGMCFGRVLFKLAIVYSKEWSEIRIVMKRQNRPKREKEKKCTKS